VLAVADCGATFELSFGFVAGAARPGAGALADWDVAEPDGVAVECAGAPVPCEVAGLCDVAGAVVAGAGPDEVGLTRVQAHRKRKAGSPAIAICRIVHSQFRAVASIRYKQIVMYANFAMPSE
jgi:hypothetical protein